MGSGGQGRFAFTVTLPALLNGERGIGLGNFLYLLDAGQAEVSALDLLGLYTYRFDPRVCAGV